MGDKYALCNFHRKGGRPAHPPAAATVISTSSDSAPATARTRCRPGTSVQRPAATGRPSSSHRSGAPAGTPAARNGIVA